MHSAPCTQCRKPVTDEHTLCEPCELRFALTLLRLAASITPLHDMLDATVHYGVHESEHTQTATPPTPIRLAVLDTIDDITSHAYELRRVLLGMPDPEHEATYEDVIGTLTVDAGAPNLSTHPCAGMYMRTALRLMQTTDLLLDPPDLHDIGHCPNPLCGVMLQARDGQSPAPCAPPPPILAPYGCAHWNAYAGTASTGGARRRSHACSPIAGSPCMRTRSGSGRNVANCTPPRTRASIVRPTGTATCTGSPSA